MTLSLSLSLPPSLSLSRPQPLIIFLSSLSLSLSHYLFLSLQFFSEYEKLLHSENYVTKRQSLKVRHTVMSVNRSHVVVQLYSESYLKMGSVRVLDFSTPFHLHHVMSAI